MVDFADALLQMCTIFGAICGLLGVSLVATLCLIACFKSLGWWNDTPPMHSVAAIKTPESAVVDHR